MIYDSLPLFVELSNYLYIYLLYLSISTYYIYKETYIMLYIVS